MKQNIRRIAETAVMLALLICLQTQTKPMGQLVTGSCVNAVLAASVLIGGPVCGIAVALCSPAAAYLLGIAPQILTVPAIMAGNTVYVVLLHLLADRTGRKPAKQILAWLAAAAAKFAVLYGIVVWVICGVLSEKLLTAGVLKAPMMQALPAAFSWMQLITALIGGAAALLMTPVLRKALRR